MSPNATTTDNGQLSPSTRRWIEAADLRHRKTHGQFMTPRAVRERLIDHLDLWPGMRVLDPGVGTGEFLRSLLDREPEAVTSGWDIDEEILKVAGELAPEAALERRSALDRPDVEPFDLVLGNPPYFQFRMDPAMRRRFQEVISGRPNIFALFFKAGMDVLRTGGQLAYVVPPSMNNGAYFNALREYIVRCSEVKHLEVLDGNGLFEDANTAAQIIVMRKGAEDDGRHVFARSADRFHRTVFSENPTALAAEFDGRNTLWSLGFEAVTGTVVWNQNRPLLRSSNEAGTVPLIWAHNIEQGSVVLNDSHPKRPQYVISDRPLTGPAVVVNRIVGAVGAGQLRCGLVPDGMSFVGENHVNVIRPRRGVGDHAAWEDLIRALQEPEVAGRIRMLTGNTQVSATELTHLLPLDVDGFHPVGGDQGGLF